MYAVVLLSGFGVGLQYSSNVGDYVRPILRCLIWKVLTVFGEGPPFAIVEEYTCNTCTACSFFTVLLIFMLLTFLFSVFNSI